MKILHLSDLHLGDDLLIRSLLRLKSWRKQPSKKLTDGLKAAIRDLNPDYVVISGDFVNKPNEESFAIAAKYVRELLFAAGVDLKTQVLVVPGNHDASFIPKAQPDDAARLRTYRHFLKELFGETDVETRKTRYVHVDQQERTVFACFDSTLKDYFPLAEGQIGVGQLRWLQRKMARAEQLLGNNGRHIKIAVLHHHCVAIKGSSAGSDRFMTLLDAGDVLPVLESLGFNLILHGHKHHPHVTTMYRSDGTLMVFVGAGTATNPYLEEQNQFGNNFNCITVDLNGNLISIQRYKADGNGQFVTDGAVNSFPIYRIVGGYIARKLRKAVDVSKDGSIDVFVGREGIRVEHGSTMQELEFGVSSDAVTAEITDFTHSTQNIRRIVKSSDSKTVIRGKFEFANPLTASSPPLDLWYSHKVLKGNAMSIEEASVMYAEQTLFESTSVIVTGSADELEMEVNFPQNYAVQPRVRVEHLGAKVNVPLNIRKDGNLNRWEVHYANPPLNHIVRIEWDLPATWQIK